MKITARLVSFEGRTLHEADLDPMGTPDVVLWRALVFRLKDKLFRYEGEDPAPVATLIVYRQTTVVRLSDGDDDRTDYDGWGPPS